MTTLLVALGTFLLSLVATGKVLRYALQRLLDVPNERSSHVRPTPTGGGAGFLLALALGLLAGLWLAPDRTAWLRPHPALLALAGVPLAITGWIDDRQGLSRSVRYLVQLATAGLTVWGLAPESLLTNGLAGQATAVILLLGLTVATTAVINFVNFMDGMDGLVGGVCAVIFAWLAVWSAAPIWWLLVAALAGFLFWNWPPARIFMGDVGSTTLGLLVAAGFLTVLPPRPEWWRLAVVLPLLGDAVYTLARRLLRGENVLQAHNSHIYQRLRRSGWSHGLVSGLYIGLTAVCGALAQWWAEPGGWAGLGLWLVALVAAEVRINRCGVPFAVARRG